MKVNELIDLGMGIEFKVKEDIRIEPLEFLFPEDKPLQLDSKVTFNRYTLDRIQIEISHPAYDPGFKEWVTLSKAYIQKYPICVHGAFQYHGEDYNLFPVLYTMTGYTTKASFTFIELLTEPYTHIKVF